MPERILSNPASQYSTTGAAPALGEEPTTTQTGPQTYVKQETTKRKGIFSRIGKRTEDSSRNRIQQLDAIRKRREEGQGGIATLTQRLGVGAGYASDFLGTGINEAARAVYGASTVARSAFEEGGAGDVKARDKIAAETVGNAFLRSKLGKEAIEVLGEGMAGWEEYKTANPEKAANIEAVINIADFASNFVGAKAGQVAVKKAVDVAEETVAGATRYTGDAMQGIKNAARGAGDAATSAINDSPTAQGVVRGVTDLAERFPRAGQRVKEAVKESAGRAARIKASAPAVGKAIKSGLDDRVIKTVEVAEESALKAYREMVEFAENTGDTLKQSKRPAVVAGDAAAKQFDLLDKQRRAVGKKIGEAVKEMSKTTKVSMRGAFDKMDDVMDQLGISHTIDEDGIRMNFSATGFTPAQRIKIKELYSLAKEAGDEITPLQIYDKDRLFSQLQREAKMGEVGDILVDTADGNKASLFSVFRDVFSDTLDEVSPQDIRALNKEYKGLRRLVDDVEDSIFKTPGFETVKSSDPAEFAKVNLRRILSEAQSQPAYEQIAKKLDETSRALGYDGATPSELIAFAEALKKLYPDTIPDASFAGGIRLGVKDIAEKIMTVGAPALKDKQRALKELLEDLLGRAGEKKVKRGARNILNPKATGGVKPSPAQQAIKDGLTEEQFVKGQGQKEGAATRFGEIDKNGAYFSTGEKGSYNPNYFNAKTETGTKNAQYNVQSAKIVKSHTPEARKVLEEALKDTKNTQQQINLLRRELGNPDNLNGSIITWQMNDQIPSIVTSAKKLGYDGIKVIEAGDVSNPTSLFIWNTDKVKLIKTSSQLRAEYQAAKGLKGLLKKGSKAAK